MTAPTPPTQAPQPAQAQSGSGNKPKFRLTAAWASVIVALIAIPGGWLGGYFTAPGASSSSTTPVAVSIDSPENNQVPVKASLSGRVSNLHAGESVWLFVQRVANKQPDPTTYPGDGPCTVNLTDGTWHCNITVGSSGNTYQICPAVLSFAQADDVVTLLQAAAYDSKLPKTAKPHTAWFSSPPSYIDSQICATVTTT